MKRTLKCLKNCFPCYISLVDPFNILFVRLDHELEHLRNFRHVMVQVVRFRRIGEIEWKSFKQQYDRL